MVPLCDDCADEQKVRDDRAKVEKEGFWIYNDLPRAYDEAKKSGKPMLVIMRCIPCEECVKLDDDLVNQDKRVRPLLEKFVCVRIVSTNGLDLSLFQYDYDQSFAAFLMNADGAVYGRFGTRSHRTYWSDDVSIEGLSKALQTGLELHAQYPKIKDSLVGKRGPAPEMAEKPRHQLLTQEVDHYVKLSAANTATARMAIWTDWATDIGQESRVIHKVAQPEDMAALAAMFEKTVNRGVVAQAEKMQTVPPAERHAALTTAIDKLAVAMADADALARSAPTVTQKYFTRMAETARDARQILLVKREAGI